jgi:hypothetical protein
MWLGAGAALAGAATWAVLQGRLRPGGALAGAAAVSLVAGGVAVRRHPAPLWRFLDATVSLAFDGAVLSAIALTLRGPNPSGAAAAAAALIASFVGAYVRARGQALSYPVEDSIGTRALRYGLVVVALVSGRPAIPLFILLGFTITTALIRASQVAKQERE